MAAQPGLPAFWKIRHMATISSTLSASEAMLAARLK